MYASEQLEIERLKKLAPGAFGENHNKGGVSLDDELVYRYMIHVIAKCYGVSIREASEYREKEFFEMVVFEDFEKKKSYEPQRVQRQRGELYPSDRS
jgi:hypothetical protein